MEYHVDHRIPISRGGLHHPDNLWVIPATENLRKYNKLPEELAA
jgi:5-methylcytosine-specific restriction endonuclease McrA